MVRLRVWDNVGDNLGGSFGDNFGDNLSDNFGDNCHKTFLLEFTFDVNLMWNKPSFSRQIFGTILETIFWTILGAFLDNLSDNFEVNFGDNLRNNIMDNFGNNCQKTFFLLIYRWCETNRAFLIKWGHYNCFGGFEQQWKKSSESKTNLCAI